MQFFSWLVSLSLLPSTPIVTPPLTGPSPVAGTPRVTSLSVAVGQDPWLASRTEAERILEDVQYVYANCFFYRDSGKVESVFVVPGQDERTVVRPFETAFSRDEDLFRYEFRDSSFGHTTKRYVVWRDGADARSWWTIKPQVREWDRLSTALGAAAGVSSRSSTIVPSMLMGWRSQFLSHLVDPHIIGSEVIDGIECVKIEGLERVGGAKCTVWVDETRLVRKMHAVREIVPVDRRPFMVHWTITWAPILDEEIPRSALDFDPPYVIEEQEQGTEQEEEVPEPDPEAALLLDKAQDVYATCDTYRDEGEVEIFFIIPGMPDRTVVRPFETAFVRQAGAFRFEFRDRAGEHEWNKYVVWSDGTDAHSWWTIKPQVRDFDDLNRALKGVGGVSGMSASIVPPHLLDGPEQFLAGLSNPQIIGVESVGGVRCVRIEGVMERHDHKCTIWIEEEEHLVRKLYFVRKHDRGFRPFSTRQTIVWTPSIDEAIPESALGFEPPVVVPYLERTTAWLPEVNGPDSNAVRLLKEAREVYATCDTYQDKGEVETLFVFPDRPDRTVVKPFETAFVRETGKFRFEYRDRAGEYEWNRHVVWCDGEEANSWWTIKPEVKVWDSLHLAIRRGISMSGFSLIPVPMLLLQPSTQNRMPVRSLVRMTNPWIAGSESVGGVNCVRIEGVIKASSGDERLTIWIDDEHLVRKTHSVRELDLAKMNIVRSDRDDGEFDPPFTVSTTTTWTPRIDGDIPDSAFGFEIPGK